MLDAIVVGLGGVGSFCLRALSRQGKGGRFLGVERYRRGHSRGSSHGKSRIYRRAYFEHASYVPWIEKSIGIFQELEESQNVSLLKECGTLLIGPQQDGDALPPILHESWESAVEHDILVERLSPVELQERYPQFQSKVGPRMVGLLEPAGGLVRPELAMLAALEEAQATEEVSILEEAHVVSFKDYGDHLELVIVTDRGEERVVQTRSLLVSAGAWTGQILPELAPHLHVIRQIQGWIDTTSTSLQDMYHDMPTWVMSTPAWPLPLYGLPSASEDSKWIKVGIHGRNAQVADPSQNSPEATQEEIQELARATATVLDERLWKPDTTPTFCETSPCFYTMSPDGHFVVGEVRPRVFAVAGLSGHGFKMTPALGQMMADYALGHDLSKWKLDFCSPKRLGL